eukprot:CAMPEP_0182562364 /NCGR_PEP_ID=MMETSP1324-20130603/4722_1 /TAXON_ID=236786 /ORGANISM="Florenciella sp., Strain RCC1587" /LENGTH=162 /DNA_ID=CAMNT_0024775299 /DNA_START=1059 /DNA_END=1547 /DNA_ORIENTATION=-
MMVPYGHVRRAPLSRASVRPLGALTAQLKVFALASRASSGRLSAAASSEFEGAAELRQVALTLRRIAPARPPRLWDGQQQLSADACVHRKHTTVAESEGAATPHVILKVGGVWHSESPHRSRNHRVRHEQARHDAATREPQPPPRPVAPRTQWRERIHERQA